ncbi:hypothetical protein LOZ53_002025 [Ophidiomyces ophidiicola]|nr:hypothetical protein LOZ55_003903 [Ophidiomyces ophidiicola]KAI1985009.1 hypothetical protein LOZ51_006543 [Ophidiomyces ophidiicola]KAI1987506.1 hypothetical protein LOZ54_003562 [Ophidiomyces ophidiicola]KAI1993813.1 hypothetical protein LOZ53_002025 [Ophidiomyces ophidiicola]
MSCYGRILTKEFNRSFPRESPPLTKLEHAIIDEDSFEHLLTRSVTPAVNEALVRACEYSYGDRIAAAIEMTRGGRARRPDDPTDSTKFKENSTFPDWAGIVYLPKSPHLKNWCPGETKLSSKWKSHKLTEEGSYYWPLFQACQYCQKWNTRYGYLITQHELVVLRFFKKDEIGSGLAAQRPPRHAPPAPAPAPAPIRDRSTSAASLTSHTSHMSLDPPPRHSRESSVSSGQVFSSFPAPSTGGETRRVEMKSILWRNHGPNKLTVKLALWWIHMLAVAPDCDKTQRSAYPPLDNLVEMDGEYSNTSTGLRSKGSAGGRGAGAFQNPSTPEQHRRTSDDSSPLSSPMSVETPAHMRRRVDMDEFDGGIRWNAASHQFRYRTLSGSTGTFPEGAILFSSTNSAYYRAQCDSAGQPTFIPCLQNGSPQRSEESTSPRGDNRSGYSEHLRKQGRR